MLALGIVTAGILSRVIIHAPNFTPVITLALFSGVYLKKKTALVTPVILMVLSDIIIGAHNTMLFTWGSVALIALIGLGIKGRKSFSMILGASVASAFLFFIVTNIGAWLTLYPRTGEGLVTCFVAAIPFFSNSLLSTLGYSLLIFGGYEVFAAQARKVRWAGRLLAEA